MRTLLTTKRHEKLKSWNEMFPNEVDLSKIYFHKSWEPLFSQLFSDNKYQRTKESLEKETSKENVKMYPPPELLFNAFALTSLDKVKVVILGQDPYFDKGQAMGLSFSVPYGKQVPSSLENMYKNLKNFGHINDKPTHGNLEMWAHQGCLMLNTSLTVLHGADNKNCHQSVWRWFTDKIISYISQNKEKVIFVLWGASALEKANLIDTDKHDLVISSHPSGLSADKPMKSYPSFNSFDHFGQINNILKKWNMQQIVWELGENICI